MATVSRHQSPDGRLTLLVLFGDGDWTIGFEGFAFHTHGDILYAWGYPGSPEEATRSFVSDILESRRIILVYRLNGEMRDVDVPTDFFGSKEERAANLKRYGAVGEIAEGRYWDGRVVAG